MAEGLLRRLAPDQFEVESAGTEATRVHPLAIEVMRELGVDISGHRSKTLDSFVAQPWDYVTTVCDHVNERCPLFPSAIRRLHWSFEDPSAATGTEAERLAVFRRVRDAIAARLTVWLAEDQR